MGTPTPFRVDVPQARLDQILRKVRDFPWQAADMPADGGDWRYGPPHRYLRDLCACWTGPYDWRRQEAAMNRWPHFTAEVDGTVLHFVHERAGSPNRPPLLLLHGWPYSFYSFLPLIEPLAHPERTGGDPESGFDVIVPSLPGYAFSGKPDRPMGPLRMAALINKLMTEVLGYGRYAAHGGDWGGDIASLLGFHHAGHVAGLHVNTLMLRSADAPMASGVVPPGSSREVQEFAQREKELFTREGAYAMVQGSKPLTLAYAMADSPVGVAAWIVEKFHAWSDRRRRPFEQLFSQDQLLTEVMLYLVTDSFGTATWLYPTMQQDLAAALLPEGQRVEVPVALAAFPDPVFPPPPRALAERSHNVVRYREMPGGGHFPFYEATDMLVEDLRAFAGSLTWD